MGTEDSTGMTAAPRLDRGSYGPFRVLEWLRETSELSLALCRREGGELAVVKATRTAAARAQRMIREEAAILFRLACPGHENVVQILEEAAADERAWYAMAWVDGRSLLGFRPVAVPFALRIAHSLAHALEYVHSFGIVHGDVAPSNVLINDSGNATLIDFGSAALSFDATTARELAHADHARLGTPGYLAPERIGAGIVDARSDLYALGCILFELVAGQPPFRGDDAHSLARQHLVAAPQPLLALNPGLSAGLVSLIERLLEKDPVRRPASAGEVREAIAALEPSVTSPHSGARPRRAPFARSRLVGRDSALTILTKGIERARLGNGGMLLVSGESGIGKTRLLNEAARYAIDRSIEVLFGYCADLVPSRGVSSTSRRALGPFLPFLEWVADARREDPNGWAGELEVALAALAAYQPSLRSADATVALAPLPPELARKRVLKSLALALRAASAKQPVVLVIDDVQWADDLTAAFLTSDQHASLDGAALCLIVAYRADEIADELEQGLTTNAADATRLERLTVDEIATLTRSMLGSRVVPASVSEYLHRKSGGNAFLAVEYLHAFVQDGSLRRGANGEAELSAAEHAGVPSGLQQLFDRKVRPLSAAAHTALQLSAVLGSEFQRELLEASLVRAASPGEAAAAISELETQRLLEASSLERRRFVHDKLREAQLNALSPAQRRELHRRAADLIRENARFAVPPAELGLHFAEAGLPEEAIPYLADAAEQASRRYANAEAVQLYALALEQLAALPAAASSARASQTLELSEARADVLLRSGRNREATEQYRSVSDTVDCATRARLQRKQALALWTSHQYDAAAAALDAAETALRQLGSLDDERAAHEWIEIEQGRFWLHYFARKAGPLTDAVLARMQPIVERRGSVRQRSMFFECQASHLMARDNYLFSSAAVASARHAIHALGDELADAGQASGARFVLAFSLTLGGREECREAVPLFETTLAELAPIGDPMLMSRSLVYKAIAHRRLEEAEAVRATIERARAFAERARLTHYVAACVACEAWLSWRAGELAHAAQLAEEAKLLWTQGTHAFPFRWLAAFVSLDTAMLSDDFEQSQEILDDLLEATQQRFPDPLASALELAREACAAEDARSASARLGRALQLAHEAGYL